MNNQSVAVTCHFAEGSQALGCHVKFNDSQALNISREGKSLITCQLIKTHFPSHCYQSQLYVYDWEADGKVGTVPVPVEMVFSEGSLEACGPAAGSTTSTAPSNPGVCHFLCANYL